MDEGPFRVQPSSDRRSSSRPTPSRQPETSQPVEVESSPAPQAAPARRSGKEDKKSSKRSKLPIILAIIFIVIIGVLAWIVGSALTSKSSTAIDSSKYQAVFFTNGQVYFGKLHTMNEDYMRLTDIYYLQTQSSSDSGNPQETSTDQNNVQLIKLGDEIHGPEDEMVLSKDQVLFYENLKTDGKVAKSIETYKKSN